MTTTLDSTIKNNPEFMSAVQKAARVLDSVVTKSADGVVAEWKMVTDERNQPALELTLTEPDGSLSTRLTRDDLKTDRRLESRLSWLWGDLLQQRSHKQMARLRELVSHLEDE